MPDALLTNSLDGDDDAAGNKGNISGQNGRVRFKLIDSPIFSENGCREKGNKLI